MSVVVEAPGHGDAELALLWRCFLVIDWLRCYHNSPR